MIERKHHVHDSNDCGVALREFPVDPPATVARASEHAIGENEARCRLHAETTTDIVSWCDLTARRRYISPAITAVLGFTPEEMIGASPIDSVHPDDAASFARVLNDLTEGRLERAMTFQRYRHADGSWVWMEISCNLTRDPVTGQPDGYVANMRDASARMAAEDALRRSEAQYRILAEALPQMVVITSAETGEALYTNPQFTAYHGAIAPSKQARFALVHPDDLTRVKRIWVRKRRLSRRHEVEARLLRRDGLYRWHRIVTMPIAQADRVEALISTALDIDEIVRGREELRRANDLLRVAQDAAAAGAWDYDPNHDRVVLSAISARMHCLTAPDACESTTIEISIKDWEARVFAEDLAGVWAAVEHGLTTGTTFNVEFRALAPDHPAGCRWIQSIGRAVADSKRGEVARFVGLHLDVTSRRSAEENFRSSEARLRVSEERLALALDSSEGGLFDWDIATDEIWFSERWLNRLGLPSVASPFRAGELTDAVHPDDRDQVWQAYHAHISGTTPILEVEYRRRQADGDYFWAMSRARIVEREPDGKPRRMVGTIIDISQRKTAELRIQHMAHYDSLTGLPNRNLLRSRIDRALAHKVEAPNQHAILVCDLDHFKSINDTLGHLMGDRVLHAVAERISATVRRQDTVARLGGDEFAVVLDDIDGEASVQAVCERIIAVLDEPVILDGLQIDTSISIGGALVPGIAADAEEVFKRADMALFQAKSAGRGTYRLFEATAHARIATRSSLALDMKDAIRRGDFFLVYQPIIDVAAGAVVSFEALLRWRHPQHGLVSPADFIPVAEDTGLITPLGAWVLAEACREATNWPEGVKVSVNVSAVQFRSGLEETVLGTLATTGLPAYRLKLEVTESLLVQNPEEALAILHRLRGAGVKIALDDFGTGYSSLSYLRRFPFDKIKIDRAFIRDIADPDAAAIVRAMVGIGERLGMGIVAEGVETQEQLDLVRREGCTEVQGFLFSKPLLAAEAIKFVSDNRG